MLQAGWVVLHDISRADWLLRRVQTQAGQRDHQVCAKETESVLGPRADYDRALGPKNDVLAVATNAASSEVK